MNIEIIRENFLSDLKQLQSINKCWLNTEELADYLDLSTQQLEMWRGECFGPCYLRLGKRKIIYPKEAIADFLVANPVKTL